MAMNRLLLVLLAAVAMAAVSGTDAQTCPVRCGSQGRGAECPNNLCCSRDGECGLSAAHCGEGCQSGVCHPNNRRCGNKFGHTVCPNNQCCSSTGFCGIGYQFCSNNCQSGACYSGMPYCNIDKPCPYNYCCSHNGQCGIGFEYCGDGCINGPCYYGGSAAMAPSPAPASGLDSMLELPQDS